MATALVFGRRTALNLGLACAPILLIALIGNVGGRGVGKGYLGSAIEGAAPWIAVGAAAAVFGSLVGELLAALGVLGWQQRVAVGLACAVTTVLLGAPAPFAALTLLIGALIQPARAHHEPSAGGGIAASGPV